MEIQNLRFYCANTEPMTYISSFTKLFIGVIVVLYNSIKEQIVISFLSVANYL
jgi:hypothetical protein